MQGLVINNHSDGKECALHVPRDFSAGSVKDSALQRKESQVIWCLCN